MPVEIGTAIAQIVTSASAIAAEAAVTAASYITPITVGSEAAGVATAAAIVAPTALTVASQIQEAKEEKAAGKYNIALAEQKAKSIEQARQYNIELEKEKAREFRSRQLVQFAKSGVLPTTGQPLLVRAETSINLQRDIGMTSYGYGLERAGALSEAQLERLYKRSRTRASRYKIGTTLLTGTYRTSKWLM